MFTYLDTTVRERLINQGKLKRLNTKGEEIDAERARLEEPALDLLGPIPLPLHLDDIDVTTDWYAFVRHTELAKVDELATELREHAGERYFSMLASFMAVNSVLLVGDPQSNDSPLVRVHSSCLTGDVFGSLRCECGPQLALALERIREDPAGGIVVYMSGHEGRGIGLWAKAATYVLQDAGENTYQANRSLGLPDDSRDFTDAAAILRYFLDDRPFRLLTNNPKKVNDLAEHGLTKITQVKHVVGVGDWNRRYLAAKREWGHDLSPDDLERE
jgi:GTP cyclohydrolase II